MTNVYYNGVLITDPYNLPTYVVNSSIIPPSNSGGFNNNQSFVLDLSARIAAGLSVAATLVIMATFMGWKKFRTSANRLIVFMAFADLISAVATLLGK